MSENRIGLKIELRSDLCSGSGYSYAGVIDTDVVYDEYGLPYIPGKRLKGCLREAAEIICEKKEINRIFGERGADRPGILRIGNAILGRSSEFHEELKQLSKRSKIWRKFLTPDEILKLYTSVRTQTEIGKDGAAEEKSLRFTRVVNQFDPFEDEKPLCFFAELFYQADSEEDACETKKILKKIAMATRNIGMDRNRGLGSVSCTIVRPEELDKNKQNDQKPTGGTSKWFLRETLPEGQIKISYLLENTAPLLLSDKDENDTVSYISGKSVLGALAGKYLRKEKRNEGDNPAETTEFANLFLKGMVKYTNANPAFGEEEAFPAPLYLNRLKKTRKYVNVLDGDGGKAKIQKANESQEEEQTPIKQAYDISNGNEPRKLKTQFAALTDKNGRITYSIVEPEKELIFHHRHEHGKDEPEALLYSVETLKSGQRFAGAIYVEPSDEMQSNDKQNCQEKENERQNELVKCLEDLLQDGELRFGKSKSSQYGTCRLIPFEKRTENTELKKEFSKGDTVVVTLKSDAIFINDLESYTIKFEEVRIILARELGLEYCSQEKDDNKCMIQPTEVTGYSGIWNMRRPAVPALKAGSAFVYTLANDLKSWPNFVGERCQEGFGEIDIRLLNAMSYMACDSDADSENDEESGKGESVLSKQMQKVLACILKPHVLEALLLQAPSVNGLGSSNIGRITLMLKESLELADKSAVSRKAHKANKAAEDFPNRIQSIKTKEVKDEKVHKADKAAEDFANRIQSIKTKQVKDEAVKWLEMTLTAPDITPDIRKYSVDTGKLQKMLTNDEVLMSALDNLGDEGKKQLFLDIWGDYMLQSLIIMKYDRKETI